MAMLIQWDGSLALGHPEIDAQHEALVGVINRLHAMRDSGGGQAGLRALLLELYSYSVQHFRQEEALMDALSPEARAAHKKEHEDFAERLYELAERAAAGDEGIGTEIFRWLVSWLLEHISVTDKALAACIAKGG